MSNHTSTSARIALGTTVYIPALDACGVLQAITIEDGVAYASVVNGLTWDAFVPLAQVEVA